MRMMSGILVEPHRGVTSCTSGTQSVARRVHSSKAQPTKHKATSTTSTHKATSTSTSTSTSSSTSTSHKHKPQAHSTGTKQCVAWSAQLACPAAYAGAVGVCKWPKRKHEAPLVYTVPTNNNQYRTVVVFLNRGARGRHAHSAHAMACRASELGGTCRLPHKQNQQQQQFHIIHLISR